MKLIMPWAHMRGMKEPEAFYGILDEDSCKDVGTVHLQNLPPRRHVSLFGGKYEGAFTSNAECSAFLKGVEAVLNHMVATDEKPAKADETNEAA
jgi:hypothetical protein